MRLPDETEERGMGVPVIYTMIAVCVFVLVILGIVLVSNQEKSGSKKKNSQIATVSPTPTAEVVFAEGQEDIEALYHENKLRAEDLDFWDMYKTDEVPEEAEPTISPSPSPTHSPTPEELAADGKHILITDREGEEKWVEISEKLPQNEYDLTDIKIVNGKMAYYQDGEKCSTLGVDLSKSSGKVDFELLKADGIDFVMLKIGGRGYDSGVITLDDNFPKNIAAAKEAGLEIGVYFFSQAITVEEAVEEVEFVTENLVPYQQQITYPVVFDMEYIVNDESRIELTDTKEKTEIAKAFLSGISDAGYEPMIYGNKNWLLGEIESEVLLKEYDVWLNDQSPVPDYPYDYKMWKYSAGESINGIEGSAGYTVSFVDYTRR
ncbi:MAG: hypothetical protein IJ409_11045 [Lachnospiraceae bacterium]|nr:hypothetical protein [Lachnospiraceae bacterium]